MNLVTMLAVVAAAQTAPQLPNPYLLPIGAPGTVKVSPGQITRLSDGVAVSPSDVAKAARGTRFVYLGELHDQLSHHQMQAAIIEALVKDGRDVIVGFEQFTRPFQDALNPWTLGWWTDEEFIQKADWKANWGMDFALYKPIFDVTKQYKLPMVALNVPRDWVRRVSRGGFNALTPEERATVPTPDLTNKDHRSIFSALMGGHPVAGERGENIYTSQVLWDEAMADSAIKYMAARPTSAKTVFVVVAGSGHVMYGQGINYRAWKRTGDRGITVTKMTADEATEVARGLGDFVYATKPEASPKSN